jgi:hypothetical protein
MPTRSVTIEGKTRNCFPSGSLTQYDRYEFCMIFFKGTRTGRSGRYTRYSPVGSRSREQSLVELSEDELHQLFSYSQPSDTSPEADYSV